jgi:transcriptional regulator with XRE-family HTH domain
MFNEVSFYTGIGQKVKDARERCGLTQEELASQISLSRTSITNIEKGRQKIMLHTLIEIAIALSVTADSLLPEIDLNQKNNLDERLKLLPLNKRRWVKKTLEIKRDTRNKL